MTFTVPSNGMPYEERQAYLGVLYDPVFGVKAIAAPTTNPAMKRGSCAWKRRRETGNPDKGWKAGEAIRTPDIHVGNVMLYH